MDMKTVLFEDFRDKFELELPPTSVADIPKLKEDLRFPPCSKTAIWEKMSGR
jgi:hypothetical protein